VGEEGWRIGTRYRPRDCIAWQQRETGAESGTVMGLPHSRVGSVLTYEVARVAQAATHALSKMRMGRRDLRDSPLLPEVPAPSPSKPTAPRS